VLLLALVLLPPPPKLAAGNKKTSKSKNQPRSAIISTLHLVLSQMQPSQLRTLALKETQIEKAHLPLHPEAVLHDI
jgi:hypothetical protein